MVKNCNNCAHRKIDKCMYSGYYCTVTRSCNAKCDWQQKEPLKLNGMGWFSLGVLIGIGCGFLLSTVIC
jgi:hypothetical protein